MRQLLYVVFILLAIFSMVGLILYGTKWNIDQTYGLFNNSEEELAVLGGFSPEKCLLPHDKNPWDESIMPHFNHLYGYQKQCNHDELRTKLANGILQKTKSDDHCWGRCLYWKDDYEFTWSEWTNEAKQFKCDLIEARCSTNGNIEEFENY